MPKPSLFDRWQARAAGVLALVGTAVAIWTQIPRSPVDGRHQVERVEAAYAEMGVHFGKAPERTVTLFDDVRGRHDVLLYPDGCTVRQRTDVIGRMRTLLEFDPMREATGEVKASHLVLPVLYAAGQSPGPGRCVASHPDAPRSDWGRRISACVVELIYTWADTCQAVAHVDTCRGSMVQSPRFTRCVH